MKRSPHPVRIASLVSLVWLSACTSMTGGPASTGGPDAPAPSVSDERWRLQRELAGTPVDVDLAADGRLLVAVPLRYCFDAGRSAVKPPLAAVLEKLAGGLRRQNTTLRVRAPGDARGSRFLATDRAASVRDYLVSLGVSARRFVSVAPAEGDAVEILVDEPPR
jgi:outer membrane protein OmpA-like peptidoglycan-associated protein